MLLYLKDTVAWYLMAARCNHSFIVYTVICWGKLFLNSCLLVGSVNYQMRYASCVFALRQFSEVLRRICCPGCHVTHTVDHLPYIHPAAATCVCSVSPYWYALSLCGELELKPIPHSFKGRDTEHCVSVSPPCLPH